MLPFWSTIRTSLPLAWNVLWHSETHDFWLDSPHLFYLCKLNSVVHKKCQKGAFCMDYKAKFTDWGKTSEMSQAWSDMLRHNSKHGDLHVMISGTGWPQENRILSFFLIHKKIGFHPNQILLSAEVYWMYEIQYRIRWENINFDVMGTSTKFTIKSYILCTYKLNSWLKSSRPIKSFLTLLQ